MFQGHHIVRWILISPVMSKNNSKTIWSFPLYIVEKSPVINSNGELTPFMASARLTKHGINYVGGIL